MSTEFVSNRDIASSINVAPDVFAKFCLVTGGIVAATTRIRSSRSNYSEKGMQVDDVCNFMRARSTLFGSDAEKALRAVARLSLRAAE